jgi:putative endonuclease
VDVNAFWIYMLECENGAFYVGYTKNLVRRFRQHLDGTANVRYTRSFTPTRLSQCWRLYGTVGHALKVEKMIKNAGRPVKERLVKEPRELRRLVENRLALDTDIFTFDPLEVETKSRELQPEQVKSAKDPFASSPAIDL